MTGAAALTAVTLLLVSQAAGATDPGSSPPDYNEHLEIDFEDKDDTPPPWEEPEGPGRPGQEQQGPGAGEREDTDWVADAVRDVGYYLRQHKFNEHDRRDNPANNVTGVELGFVGAFPTLRSLHWEVRDACDQGFLQCLRHLQDKLSVVRLRRADDTAKAMWDAQLSWPVGSATPRPGQDAAQDATPAEEAGAFGTLEDKLRHQNRQQVLALDKACADLKADDEADYTGFLGPLDRFQWRTTAAYYMCAFTMKEEPALRRFGEPCDNWAWCLDLDVGPSNGDPRARDEEPYQCARYSFCPDPCCPRRQARAPADCVEDNPCRYATETVAEVEPGARTRCSLPAGPNTSLRGMMANRWNTSCRCASPGYQWDARFGLCVDTDECEVSNPCNDRNHEECVNTAGSFVCRCRWGWRRGRGRRAARCVADPAARLAALALRGGEELPDQGRRRGAWEVLEDILVPPPA